MTINSEIRRAGPFTGNGVTTQFPFDFKVFKAEDLYVVVAPEDGDGELPLELGTGYTVVLNPDQNAVPGGNIIAPSPLPVGFTLTVTSALNYLQPIDLTNQGGFYPRVINDGLDRLTIFVQQLFEGLGRSLKIPLSDGPIRTQLPGKAARANRLLSFNQNGEPTATAFDIDELGHAAVAARIAADEAKQSELIALDAAERAEDSAEYAESASDLVGRQVAAVTPTVERFSGDGASVSFELSVVPGNENNTQVYISGVYQQKDTYEIDGVNLIFSEAPPEGDDNIEVVVAPNVMLERANAQDVVYTGPDGLAYSLQDLADPDKGAAIVARAPICVDSVADLLALPSTQRKEGVGYLVASFHRSSVTDTDSMPSGGGVFYLDKESTLLPDGGIVFNDGWRRFVQGFVAPEFYGGGDAEHFEKAARSGLPVRPLRREYSLSREINLDMDNVYIDLSGVKLIYNGSPGGSGILVTGQRVTLVNPTIDRQGVSGAGIRLVNVSHFEIKGLYTALRGNCDAIYHGAIVSHGSNSDLRIEDVLVVDYAGDFRTVYFTNATDLVLRKVEIRGGERGGVGLVNCVNFEVGGVQTSGCSESVYVGFRSNRGTVGSVHHRCEALTVFPALKLSRGADNVTVKHVDIESANFSMAMYAHGAKECRVLEGRVINTHDGGNAVQVANHSGDGTAPPNDVNGMRFGRIYAEGHRGTRVSSATQVYFENGYHSVGRSSVGFSPESGNISLEDVTLESLSDSTSTGNGAALGVVSHTVGVLRVRRTVLANRGGTYAFILPAGPDTFVDAISMWVARNGSTQRALYFRGEGRFVDVTTESQGTLGGDFGSAAVINDRHIQVLP